MRTQIPIKSLITAGLASLLLCSGFGQSASSLDKAVLDARTVRITPRQNVPTWMDFKKVAGGLAFEAKYEATVSQVLGTSSLAATFAARDITPVLMTTGRLPTDFVQRLRETNQWMNTILEPASDREKFVSGNYAQAVELGEMHASVAEMVQGKLGWDVKERVPMNQQSYAFVLYTFAWWPIESLMASGKVDPVRDAAELSDWFHLWSVIGYGMGVPESLLPTDFEQAKRTVEQLRAAQYVSGSEKRPEGIPVLLGAHVNMLAAMAAKRAPERPGKPKPAPKDMIPSAAFYLATMLSASPGLNDALGLSSDTIKKLTQYGTTPVSN